MGMCLDHQMIMHSIFFFYSKWFNKDETVIKVYEFVSLKLLLDMLHK